MTFPVGLSVLFGPLKNALRDCCFASHRELKNGATRQEIFYSEGTQQLVHCCITYVEKQWANDENYL